MDLITIVSKYQGRIENKNIVSVSKDMWQLTLNPRETAESLADLSVFDFYIKNEVFTMFKIGQKKEYAIFQDGTGLLKILFNNKRSPSTITKLFVLRIDIKTVYVFWTDKPTSFRLELLDKNKLSEYEITNIRIGIGLTDERLRENLNLYTECLQNYHMLGRTEDKYQLGGLMGALFTYSKRIEWLQEELATRIFSKLPQERLQSDFVDLGLPSGKLWATKNLGANSKEDAGSHFAYGETKTKTFFDWGTYQYGESYNTMSKYNLSVSYGRRDYKTIIDIKDDIAHELLGGRCHIPMMRDFDELIRTCNWSFKGNGWNIEGPNGNSIFLPLAGTCEDGYLGYQGRGGYYMTSEIDVIDCNTVYILYLTDEDIEFNNVVRCFGRSIRPVCEP